jgi:hypothetical protein
MILINLANFGDPMKKREEFSVSLRKQRKSEIIMSKRKRKPVQDESPVKDESANMRDDSSNRLEEFQRELEEMMVIVNSMIPPEYADSEWVSFFL